MPRFWRTSFVFASVLALMSAWGFAGVARAQATTTTATGAGIPNIALASSQPNPTRIVNGMPLGVSTRPVQLTPNGISYSDCASNMTLAFPLIVSGFDGNELLEVWAGTADCSMDANRGYGGTLPLCWEVTQPLAGLVATTSISKSINVRVQDIVGHINSIPTTPAYSPLGSSACMTQTVDTATSITLYFVGTSTVNTDISGSVAQPYQIQVDLLGPGPPTITSTAAGAGDTLLIPTWLPNTDPDTIGYDVYIDPIPGQESSSGIGAEPVLVCRDAGSSSTSDATTTDATTIGAADDATISGDAEDDADTIVDASDESSSVDVEASVADASGSSQCVLEYPSAGSGAVGVGGVCYSSVLTNNSSFVIDAGTVVESTVDAEVVDDAEDLGVVEEGGVAAGGGISNIPVKYLYQPNVSTGITAPSQTASSYNVSGLKDGTQYNIAIAAVDALGNVGPLSPLQCGTPEPIQDFWKQYRQDGGQAGGGLCALEAVGAPAGSAVVFGGLISLAAATFRRRRRNRR